MEKKWKSKYGHKNWMMKGTKEQFIKNFMTLIREVWTSENVPQEWKKGSITTIWNHRGITVSSAVGNILQELIDRRMKKNHSVQ